MAAMNNTCGDLFSNLRIPNMAGHIPDPLQNQLPHTALICNNLKMRLSLIKKKFRFSFVQQHMGLSVIIHALIVV
jgi:hypothetical protein